MYSKTSLAVCLCAKALQNSLEGHCGGGQKYPVDSLVLTGHGQSFSVSTANFYGKMALHYGTLNLKLRKGSEASDIYR